MSPSSSPSPPSTPPTPDLSYSETSSPESDPEKTPTQCFRPLIGKSIRRFSPSRSPSPSPSSFNLSQSLSLNPFSHEWSDDGLFGLKPPSKGVSFSTLDEELSSSPSRRVSKGISPSSLLDPPRPFSSNKPSKGVSPSIPAEFEREEEKEFDWNEPLFQKLVKLREQAVNPNYQCCVCRGKDHVKAIRIIQDQAEWDRLVLTSGFPEESVYHPRNGLNLCFSCRTCFLNSEMKFVQTNQEDRSSHWEVEILDPRSKLVNRIVQNQIALINLDSELSPFPFVLFHQAKCAEALKVLDKL